MRLYHPTEIVIESLDVLLAEQFTALHFDDHQVFAAGRSAMHRADRDGEAVSDAGLQAAALAVDRAVTAGNDPVLTAVLVALQADATAGKNA